MIVVKCKDNNGVGDCPLKEYCLARMNDRTIVGCNLPFLLTDTIEQLKVAVEHPTGAERKEGRKKE